MAFGQAALPTRAALLGPMVPTLLLLLTRGASGGAVPAKRRDLSLKQPGHGHGEPQGVLAVLQRGLAQSKSAAASTKKTARETDHALFLLAKSVLTDATQAAPLHTVDLRDSQQVMVRIPNESSKLLKRRASSIFKQHDIFSTDVALALQHERRRPSGTPRDLFS